MSLTNDMLINLEKRRDTRQTSNSLEVKLSNATNKSYYAIYFFMTFFICSAMTVIIYFDLPFYIAILYPLNSLHSHTIEPLRDP